MRHSRFVNYKGVFLLGFLVLGCAGPLTYPVEGKISVKGGTFPAADLQGYMVTFESMTEKTGANGLVKKDGLFTVGTFKENDGAVPGKHRVALTPPLEEEGGKVNRKVLPPRYFKLETSKIEVEVIKGKNQIQIEIDPAP